MKQQILQSALDELRAAALAADQAQQEMLQALTNSACGYPGDIQAAFNTERDAIVARENTIKRILINDDHQIFTA